MKWTILSMFYDCLINNKVSSPSILRNKSCCTAKLAVGKSSAVALLRTATERASLPARLNKVYDCRIVFFISSGNIACVAISLHCFATSVSYSVFLDLSYLTEF
jgi:hypothetical protein